MNYIPENETTGVYKIMNNITGDIYECNQARISRSLLQTGELVYGFKIRQQHG